MKVKSRWYEDDAGNSSSLRILVIPAGFVGLFTVLCSIVALFLKLPDAVSLAGIGAALVATAEGAKAWQKQSEKKNGA